MNKEEIKKSIMDWEKGRPSWTVKYETNEIWRGRGFLPEKFEEEDFELLAAADNEITNCLAEYHAVVDPLPGPEQFMSPENARHCIISSVPSEYVSDVPVPNGYDPALWDEVKNQYRKIWLDALEKRNAAIVAIQEKYRRLLTNKRFSE